MIKEFNIVGNASQPSNTDTCRQAPIEPRYTEQNHGRRGRSVHEAIEKLDEKIRSACPTVLLHTGCVIRGATGKEHYNRKEDSMQKFFQSGNAFVVAALLFLVVGALSERPGVYISIGGALLVLAFAVRKKNTQKMTENTTKT